MLQRYDFFREYANIFYVLSHFYKYNKKPCGEAQGWDEKLYILKD